MSEDIIADVYGTYGIEKDASAEEGQPPTLSDIALSLVIDSLSDEVDFTKEASEETLTKVAQLHEKVLDNLLQFDYAGRASAHEHYSALEKLAIEGNIAPLEEFFSDLEEPEAEEDDAPEWQKKILAEVQRRLTS